MEPSILKTLADNPSLMEALKKLLERKFSVDLLTSDESDIILGQMVRARLVGLKAIEEAFKEIAQYRSVQEVQEKRNEAR